MKNKILITFLLGLFSLFSSSYVAAYQPGSSSLAKNDELLAAGIKITGEAAEHARQDHAQEAYDAATLSLQTMSEINSMGWSSKLEAARGRIRLGQIMAKRIAAGKAKPTDSIEKVTKNLEQGVERLQVLQGIESGQRPGRAGN